MEMVTTAGISNSIAFTLCSNNYLAHAKTLCDSIHRHNPDFTIVIGLVDKKSDLIDYSSFFPAQVIELNEKIIPGFEEMITRYNIVELNTAVKPFFFQYLIKNHPSVDHIYYFDPDIRVYSKLDFLKEYFSENAILLTPHFFTPIEMDEHHPFENVALNYGIYNLGFLGLKAKDAVVTKFLDWWGKRTFKLGYARPSDGLFVDQLWINLVPLFFGSTFIIPHYGCNMAPWNLHERKIKKIENTEQIILENNEALIFYHFSSYNFRKPDQLTKYYDRYSFEKIPILKTLYTSYYNELVENKVNEVASIKCALKVVDYTPKLKHIIFRPVYNMLRSVWTKI
jgi:hypothetical protein